MRCTLIAIAFCLGVCALASGLLLFIDDEPRTLATYGRNFAILGGGQAGSIWYLAWRKRRACRARGAGS